MASRTRIRGASGGPAAAIRDRTAHWPGRPGRQARGAAWVQAGRRVPAGRGRADGVVSQPLGRGGQIPGVGHREKPAHQHGAGRRRHRGPGPGPPGHAARPGDVAPGSAGCPGRPGRAARRERPDARNSASARASPVSSLLAGDRRQGGEHLADRLPPGQVAVRSAGSPSSSASRDRSSLGRSGRCSARVWASLPSKRRGGRMRYTAAKRRVRPHGSRRDPRVSRFTPGSRPAAVNPGARLPGPPRGCGPPAAPRPGCPARRRPAAGLPRPGTGAGRR